MTRTDLWRGQDFVTPDASGVRSGFAALDAVLPEGGWPRGALSEILSPMRGLGEVSLVLPALRTLEASAGWIVLVAPPGRVHAPAWLAHGIPLSRLLIVQASGQDAAWACEQLLGSQALAALLAWLPGTHPRQLRRLQVAAGHTESLCLVFRPISATRQPSPAPLRMALTGSPRGLQVDILKRRGPPLAAPLELSIDRPLPWRRLSRRTTGAAAAAPAGIEA
ncbi:translesion DNA synthesis-associated protein ImuA [Nitrogeniibacter mangrovi]|uniref:translesion DNA synthesis-associated protein ImuA n=1 Tax=Nitrogeniibacter mangrovi TaxID=2016596 RepID=UPI001E458B0D|nr:translesion DNA synthesis-associated protein ImuA [Nitrogeniibacter mangrovi]